MAAGFAQIRDLSMTTNAQGLAERIAGLHAAGLGRINISLDSLGCGALPPHDTRRGI